jgi:hypothetical protein
MPSRIRILKRVVVGIAIPIEALRLAWVGHNRIRAGEAADAGLLILTSSS